MITKATRAVTKAFTLAALAATVACSSPRQMQIKQATIDSLIQENAAVYARPITRSISSYCGARANDNTRNGLYDQIIVECVDGSNTEYVKQSEVPMQQMPPANVHVLADAQFGNLLQQYVGRRE